MKRRLVLPLMALMVLLGLELSLARALATREPFQAILRGEIWVAALAAVALAARLGLIFVVPGWLAAALATSYLERRTPRA
ncbi:MAG: hypothetical protein IPI67_17690 [Myxococcales bacterium]|nr:hypothetical protein [Myxococcales bacterium]